MRSPSPVAAAPPTELSAYAPAPAMGESPTRLQKHEHHQNIIIVYYSPKS